MNDRGQRTVGLLLLTGSAFVCAGLAMLSIPCALLFVGGEFLALAVGVALMERDKDKR